MRPALTLCCLAVGLLGCSATSPSQPELQPLLATIEQRLDLAISVAAHKWDNKLPIEAPERERQVLADVRKDAADYNLTADRAAAFFSDQIEANKLVQYTLVDRWNTLGNRPPTASHDLVHEIRPRLDKLKATLMSQLGRFDSTAKADCKLNLTSALQRRTNDPLRHMALVRATAQLCRDR
ncbi:chorismate mutase [Pseudomonas sp. PSKL.D1]|uniref:chorismate mutase n=1 Tax=Pseudomonas sp. PSKL.D1 TaxID=3029060 RepID=UPI0023813D3B|nr:chorismate mutase [Pseudomonas sp. PSKL.D1]WDY58408.1 chorismate mutase [Pseudomonas sp. PSKL.D1]